jgi:hypothetical protein
MAGEHSFILPAGGSGLRSVKRWEAGAVPSFLWRNIKIALVRVYPA